MEEKALISVVVLNWNGMNVLEQCLTSLVAQTYHPLEIILVDNASTDQSIDLVKKRFPDVKLIINKNNLGFGGGNNVGIQASRGRYVMMLNNDTRLDPKCIEELKRGIEKDEKYGACASKILLEYEENLIDAAGIAVYPDGLSIGRGKLERDDRYDKEEEVFFPSGCAGLYRKEMLNEIGLFDEDFFAYADETDMGWRAQLAEWRCIYNPKAIVYHLHSASSGAYSPLKAFLVERNRFWITIKYFPLPMLLLSPFFTLYRFAFQAYGALTHRGAAGKFTKNYSPWRLIWVLLKAYGSGFFYLPRMWKKRRMLRPLRHVSYGMIFAWFKRFGMTAKEISLRD